MKNQINMRVYKKYPNRRLYDTKDSCYVNLKDIKKRIIAFETIQVLDSKTKTDVTASILLQILSELQSGGGQQVMTNQTLMQLIRIYESPFSKIFNNYLEQSISLFVNQQKIVENQFDFSSLQETSNKFIKDWQNFFTGGNIK